MLFENIADDEVGLERKNRLIVRLRDGADLGQALVLVPSGRVVAEVVGRVEIRYADDLVATEAEQCFCRATQRHDALGVGRDLDRTVDGFHRAGLARGRILVGIVRASGQQDHKKQWQRGQQRPQPQSSRFLHCQFSNLAPEMFRSVHQKVFQLRVSEMNRRNRSPQSATTSSSSISRCPFMVDEYSTFPTM